MKTVTIITTSHKFTSRNLFYNQLPFPNKHCTRYYTMQELGSNSRSKGSYYTSIWQKSVLSFMRTNRLLPQVTFKRNKEKTVNAI
jgi:hypothetical protein